MIILYIVTVIAGIFIIMEKDEQNAARSEKNKQEKKLIKQLSEESEAYWNELKSYNNSSEQGYMGCELNLDLSINDLIESYEESYRDVDGLFDTLRESDRTLYSRFLDVLRWYGISTYEIEQIPYYENPIESPNWEILNLGAYNFMSAMDTRFDLLVLKLLEQQYLLDPHNDNLRHLVLQYRDEFSSSFKSPYTD
jgi:hypothetical protein